MATDNQLSINTYFFPFSSFSNMSLRKIADVALWSVCIVDLCCHLLLKDEQISASLLPSPTILIDKINKCQHEDKTDSKLNGYFL